MTVKWVSCNWCRYYTCVLSGKRFSCMGSRWKEESVSGAIIVRLDQVKRFNVHIQSKLLYHTQISYKRWLWLHQVQDRIMSDEGIEESHSHTVAHGSIHSRSDFGGVYHRPLTEWFYSRQVNVCDSGVRRRQKHDGRRKHGRKEMFYIAKHSTYFNYGYITLGISLRTIPIVRKETRCRHTRYYFQLAAMEFYYAPFHR